MAGVINCKKVELQKNGYKDLEDWLNASPNHLYIGRDMTKHVKGAVASKWGNPFKHDSEEVSLRKYEEHIRNKSELFDSLHELDGKILGCWCVPYERCHGEILVKLFNEANNKLKNKESSAISNNESLFNIQKDLS